MNKIGLILISWALLQVFWTDTALSQEGAKPTVAFEKADSTIKEPISGEIIHLVKIGIVTDDSLESPIVVSFEPSISSTATIEDYEVIVSEVLLSNKLRSAYGQVKIKADSKAEDPEKLILKLKDNQDEYKVATEADNLRSTYVLTIENAVKITSPGSLLIGTNFDFIDGPEASNLYYDLNLSFQEVMNYKIFRVGLEAGIKQNRSISEDSTGSRRYETFKLIEGSFDEPDSVKVLRNTYNIKRYQTDFLSFYFQPTFRIPKNFSVNNSFIVGHFEVLQKKFTVNRDPDFLPVDTLTTLPNRGIFTDRVLPNPIKATSHQVNVGAGLMYLHQSQNLRAMVKGIIGINFERDEEKRFYIINIDITEQNSLVQLGAEIRGGKSFAPLSPKFNSQTTFSVYLAKKFPLKKIADLFSSD